MPVRKIYGTILPCIILIVVIVGYQVFELVRSYSVVRIANEMSVAATSYKNRLKSFESDQEYIKDLSKIEPGFAPKDVTTALRNYIKGMEGQIVDIQFNSIDLFKGDQKKAEDARNLLAQLVGKYE